MQDTNAIAKGIEEEMEKFNAEVLKLLCPYFHVKSAMTNSVSFSFYIPFTFNNKTEDSSVLRCRKMLFKGQQSPILK